MVDHDPISGMPVGTHTLVPVVGPDGALLMTEWPATDEEEEELPVLAECSDSESDEEDADRPMRQGPGLSALAPDDTVAWAAGAPGFPSASHP